MNDFLYKHRFLLLRRVVQITLLITYFGANAYGWTIIRGNLSSALFFDFIPLSDPFATLQMFFAGAVISMDVLVGVAVVLFMYGIIGGRFFCSWVCPINIITDAAAWLRRKLKFSDKNKKNPFSRNIRYWVIVISLGLSFFFSFAAFEMVSPIGIAFRGVVFGFGMGWLFLVAIFLFDLFSQSHGWCGHICPLGGFNTLIGRYSIVKVIHDSNKCINAQKCFNVCPEVEVLAKVGKESVPISGACVKCGRCIEVCPRDAFEVSIVSMAKG